MLSGRTKVAGLVGGPRQVANSLSPAIHNAGYAALGLDWVYVGFPVGAADAAPVLRGLGDAGVAGFNVTMPHKLAAAAAVDRLALSAKLMMAVNTVQVTGTGLVGWNTDGDGLISFLRHEAGVGVAGMSALVIGSGGAARSVVAALALEQARSITVLARDPERAGALAPMAGRSAFQALAMGGDGGADAVAGAELIVNATPVGQEGEEPLIPVEAISPGATVVDLVYHPLETPLVVEARRRGANAHGGLGMLVHQAAKAFEIFTGQPAPIGAMWQGARSASGTPA